jgi:glutamate synthase domain-containing protein 2/glutamate synthase domain-containing protein 1/glutamate synthase domain-containing protein 3
MNRTVSGQPTFPLYQNSYEHDSCGVGLVVDIAGISSRRIVELALGGLVNLTHRGGVGADERTGDGAGILTQLPHELFSSELRGFGSNAAPGEYGVATIFLPSNAADVAAVKSVVDTEAERLGIPVLGWRAVPVETEVLGRIASDTRPEIEQLFLGCPTGQDETAFERTLMLFRKALERAAEGAGVTDFYVASCSCRTIIYKGFCLPEDLAAFYVDLQQPEYTSAIGLFHQRYSTNTLPTWAMAQPFRYIAHNGEINTVQGNRTWMTARTPDLRYADGVGPEQLSPVVSLSGSDSASFDNVVELLYHGNRSLPHALMMMVPEPWEQLPDMPAERRAFYDFHAGLMEQWDGPAAMAFSDGVIAGATLDRNGLRPMRYAITSDGLFIAGSEAGTVEVDQTSIVEKGRLGPGQMVMVDTARKTVFRNPEIKAEIAALEPWEEWLADNRVKISDDFELFSDTVIDDLVTVQRSYGYSGEDGRLIVNPMAGEGKEPTWSMGDDAPLAVLSERVRPLSAFFRQRFAQVTNPPIDSLREKKVMALDSYIGPRANVLSSTSEAARLIHLPGVVVSETQIEQLATIDTGALKGAKLSTLFPIPAEGAPEGAALTAALDQLLETAADAISDGASVIVLSDRGASRDQVAIPMLLAVGALHHEMIRRGQRMKFDIVCESGDVWDVHQLACLIGYSAAAVHPWLALRAASALAGTRGYEETSEYELQANYVKMLEYGMLKVASKMGISTATGYRGAQIFEAIGLSQSLIDAYFTGTPSRLGGLGMAEIEHDLVRRHREAYEQAMAKLPDPGFIRFRKDGEAHGYNPTVVKALQAAAVSAQQSDYDAYREVVKSHPLTAVRDLMSFKSMGNPVPIDEVESVRDIASRFVVTAMSLGALSPEAYRSLAIGMNRVGGRSNSGEGGEDPNWYDEPGPDEPHSKIKQVASGRFGVTARYLAKASELEIKMAQGSKPGEGGQLPGHKVTEFIARVRHAVPGLPLISPPPHHDIYSIEDLAQLIYDLRQVNPNAKIGVKLVAEAGVGTIAAGVAKARADYILISGHSGGTGASPLTSIKYAGCPWELGLAETQQTLVMNGLRSRVRLRTDGGIKTPEDVVMAAMLGAEEYGFGTSVLIAIGCDMARQCHLNTCPTGIATQKEELRAKFAGTPEMVANYFTVLAQGVREVLAALGARTIDEIVGRTDLLAQRTDLTGRAELLQLDSLFAEPAAEEVRRKTMSITHERKTIDDRVLEEHGAAIRGAGHVSIDLPITTKDRTVGAQVAGAIALAHGLYELGEPKYEASFTGSAGQSFGAFTVNGMQLTLTGEANDYVGKGMAGGTIAIRPRPDAAFDTPQVIAGNTILYGATGGEAYFAGKAGERFGVRNSGATAVVEGVGDHGCEYMTGGLVAVLGPTGRNFGAGMTNGIAYVYDANGGFDTHINGESVLVERGLSAADEAELRSLIERHVALTGSALGQKLLGDWSSTVAATWKVIPRATLLLQTAPPEQVEARGAAD